MWDSALRALPTVQIDTGLVRVTEWRFAPGASTGWHRHEFNYVVVPITTGKLTIENIHSQSTLELVSGEAYARERGVEHNVINANDFEFVFVEIEIK